MKQGSAEGNQNDFLRRFFCSNCIAFLWRSCKLRIELQKEAAALAELNLTSAVPHTDCGTGRQRGRIGWLIAAGILAAALLGMLVLTLADLRRAASPIVFPVEDGVYNLTAEALVTTPEDAGSALRSSRTRKKAGPSRWRTLRPGIVSDMPRSAGAPQCASLPRSLLPSGTVSAARGFPRTPWSRFLTRGPSASGTVCAPCWVSSCRCSRAADNELKQENRLPGLRQADFV